MSQTQNIFADQVVFSKQHNVSQSFASSDPVASFHFRQPSSIIHSSYQRQQNAGQNHFEHSLKNITELTEDESRRSAQQKSGPSGKRGSEGSRQKQPSSQAQPPADETASNFISVTNVERWKEEPEQPEEGRIANGTLAKRRRVRGKKSGGSAKRVARISYNYLDPTRHENQPVLIEGDLVPIFNSATLATGLWPNTSVQHSQS